jgi:cytochrome P450/CRP-like cAMP-binding protein
MNTEDLKDSAGLAANGAPVSRCPFSPLVREWPLLGNTRDFLRDTTGFLVSSYRKHGPIFRIRMLWLKFTVILGFEAREFMSGGGERHLTRHPIFDPVGEQLGSADFALALSGEKHLQLRRLLQLAYSREVASPYVPQLVQAVRESVREWPDGSVQEVFEGVQLLAFQQYCQVMGNVSLREHYRDCRVVTDMNMEVGGRVLPLWMFHWPPYRAARRRVLKLTSDLVARHRREIETLDRPPDIIDTLLSVKFPDGRPMTDDEVVCYALYGFAGSSSYMGRLVAFMLYEIFQHPDLQAQLIEEVDAAFARGLREASEVQQMRLLRAVFHETLRFHPVSQGMPYVAKETFQFNGKRVEKGDMVVLSQLPMLFAETAFKEPARFDPSRCLEPRNEHRKGGAFNPFGMHHRTCAAMGLVETMAITMVATLLHELTLEVSPPGYRLKMAVKPLPAPNRHFKMRVRPRQQPSIKEMLAVPLREEVFLATFEGADKLDVIEALQTGEYTTYKPGTEIIRQGTEPDAFYILLEGRVEVFRTNANGSQVQLAILVVGDYFGEIGLLCRVPRNATVRVLPGSPVRVLQLSAETFRRVVAESDMVSNEIARVARKRVANKLLPALVQGMSEADLLRRLPEFTRQAFAAGEAIVREGDAADRFYFIVRGEVIVSQRAETGEERTVAGLGVGNYFGETGLIHSAPRNATVTTSGEEPVIVYSCEEPAFNRLVREAGGTAGDLALALTGRLSGPIKQTDSVPAVE